jgi:hypothetical protein
LPIATTEKNKRFPSPKKADKMQRRCESHAGGQQKQTIYILNCKNISGKRTAAVLIRESQRIKGQHCLANLNF